jgi:heme/copper-type cytochrome/quinol oxidase subunit 4
LETLIQAGARRMAVEYVPVRTNPAIRESRLIRSLSFFLLLSVVTIIRFYTMYQPLRVFTATGGLFIVVGVILGLRFLYFFFFSSRGGSGHIQSLILAAILLIIGFQICLIGLIADLVRLNRRMLEEVIYRIRKMELVGDGYKDK